jgi:hypothetical protein
MWNQYSIADLKAGIDIGYIFDFFTQFIKKLTENFNMFWKTRIFYDSLTANGNKLRAYRNLKENYETVTYLFLDIDKTLIKQFMQIKISNSKLMIELLK